MGGLDLESLLSLFKASLASRAATCCLEPVHGCPTPTWTVTPFELSKDFELVTKISMWKVSPSSFHLWLSHHH